MPIGKGTALGHYRIVNQIGAGGMGVVYRAHDEKLDRDVAIKVLHESVDQDADRLARFEREARAVAKLDHPNILAIHNFGTESGVTYAVMELLEGETLRQRIPSGGMGWQKTAEIGTAAADGLAAAHGKGIIHRDLKPQNIFVTRDGRVKILDFGIARMRAPVDVNAETATYKPASTVPGTVMGTDGYMSPEQLRGETADTRSDIFSLGCVLYEMLGGGAAFLRASTAETSAAILKEEPPALAASGAVLPAEFDRTVRRCLEKSPDERFQSASDLAYNLRSITTSHAAPMVTPSAVTPVRWDRRTLWMGAGATILVAAALFGWIYLLPSEPDLPPMRTVPLTSFPGREEDPAISPDGNMVAFVRLSESGIWDLFVKDIGGGNPLLVSDGKSVTWSPAWSPNGRRIAFYRGFMNDDGEYSIAVDSVSRLGGPSRQLTTSQLTVSRLKGAIPFFGLSWSPDGTILAMADEESPDWIVSVFLLSLETGEKRRLTAPPENHSDEIPRFSPDGRTVAFERNGPKESGFYLVPAEGGEPRPLVTDISWTKGFDWTSDGREIIFSANRSGSPGFWALWRVPVVGGEPEMLAVGEEGNEPMLSRQHALMSYARSSGKFDLWRIPGPLAGGEGRSPERFISSSTSAGWNIHPRYSPDGGVISFGSRRSGFTEMWVCDSDASNQTQLTHLEGASNKGIWSPDGRRLAFMSTAGGDWDIYVMSATGGIPRRITDDASEEQYPSWSRDGRWIYFRSDRNGSSFELYRMPAEGGEAVQLTTAGGFLGFESPDGRSLFFTKRDFGDAPHGIWRIPVEGGDEVKFHDRGERNLWEVLDEGICYLNLESDNPTVEFLEFSTGEVTWVAEVEGAARFGFGVSPDGQWVVLSIPETYSEIMLVENFR
jgi:Tol biopolymer transport system component